MSEFYLDENKKSKCCSVKGVLELFSKKDKTGVENLISESKPLTEPEEIEDCLFGTFFACEHLEIKGNEFDNLFLEEVNIIYSSIIDDTSSPINHG